LLLPLLSDRVRWVDARASVSTWRHWLRTHAHTPQRTLTWITSLTPALTSRCDAASVSRLSRSSTVAAASLPSSTSLADGMLRVCCCLMARALSCVGVITNKEEGSWRARPKRQKEEEEVGACVSFVLLLMRQEEEGSVLW
jgi:hypothetical protein